MTCRGLTRLLVAFASLAAAQPLLAQTDYYNTDAGRPLRIEDAYPVERRAFEIQAAPVRLERSRGGLYTWAIEPEIAYGVLPRTQIEAGFPLVFIDAGDGHSTAGLAGVHLSILHNLNAETALPALAVGASLALPAGPLAADEAYVSVKAMMTRTFSWARFHINGQYTAGEDLPAEGTGPLAPVLGATAGEELVDLVGLAGQARRRQGGAPLRQGETAAVRPVELTADPAIVAEGDRHAVLREGGLRRAPDPRLQQGVAGRRHKVGD